MNHTTPMDPARTVRLVTVAHGTRFGPGNRVALELTRRAGASLDLPAVASFVELCEPSLERVMQESDEPTVVVPLLLSSGYHLRVDLPAAVAQAGSTVRLGGPLGPHPLLARAQADRLNHAGHQPGQPVLMVAAGSNDETSLPDLEQARQHLADELAVPVRLATLSGLGRRPEELVTADDAVSPYLLAPGNFVDRTHAATAAAAVRAPAIGPHPDVVELIAERARDLSG